MAEGDIAAAMGRAVLLDSRLRTLQKGMQATEGSATDTELVVALRGQIKAMQDAFRKLRDQGPSSSGGLVREALLMKVDACRGQLEHLARGALATNTRLDPAFQSLLQDLVDFVEPPASASGSPVPSSPGQPRTPLTGSPWRRLQGTTQSPAWGDPSSLSPITPEWPPADGPALQPGERPGASLAIQGAAHTVWNTPEDDGARPSDGMGREEALSQRSWGVPATEREWSPGQESSGSSGPQQSGAGHRLGRDALSPTDRSSVMSRDRRGLEGHASLASLGGSRAPKERPADTRRAPLEERATNLPLAGRALPSRSGSIASRGAASGKAGWPRADMDGPARKAAAPGWAPIAAPARQPSVGSARTASVRPSRSQGTGRAPAAEPTTQGAGTALPAPTADPGPYDVGYYRGSPLQDPAAGAGRSFGGLVRVPSLRSIGGKSRAPSLSPGPPHPRARPQLVPTPDIVPATEAWVSRGWTQEDGAGTEDMARPQPRERASGKEVVDWTTDTESWEGDTAHSGKPRRNVLVKLAGGMFGLLRGAAVLTLRLVVTAGLVAASAGVTAVALSAANGGSIGATVHTSREAARQNRGLLKGLLRMGDREKAPRADPVSHDEDATPATDDGPRHAPSGVEPEGVFEEASCLDPSFTLEESELTMSAEEFLRGSSVLAALTSEDAPASIATVPDVTLGRG